MQIGVVGLNHKLASLRLRENLARACQERFSSHCTQLGSTATVLLSTCNRTEIYFSSNDLAASHSDILQVLRDTLVDEFEHRLYSYFGRDCFQHLASVTSGLDSAILGETEIQGQVKTAYETTAARHDLPHAMHYAFQKSLRIGKRVRSEVMAERSGVTLEGAIVKTGAHFFKRHQSTRVLFIGASEINRKIFDYFRDRDILDLTVCNRSADAAQLMAQRAQGDWLPWSQLDQWPTYDWVVLATNFSGFLITSSDLEGHESKRRLILDLSVPRNADLALAKCPETALLNIDQVNRVMKGKLRKLARSAAQAEELIDDAVDRLFDGFQAKKAQRLHLVAAS